MSDLSTEIEPTLQEIHKKMVNSLHFPAEVDKTYVLEIGPSFNVAITLNNRLERI